MPKEELHDSNSIVEETNEEPYEVIEKQFAGAVAVSDEMIEERRSEKKLEESEHEIEVEQVVQEDGETVSVTEMTYTC